MLVHFGPNVFAGFVGPLEEPPRELQSKLNVVPAAAPQPRLLVLGGIGLVTRAPVQHTLTARTRELVHQARRRYGVQKGRLLGS